MPGDLTAFYVFATIAVVSSLGVIGQGNPMYSVLLLIASFGALSGLYVLLDAPLVAVTQIIVYAGAIMVVFLFVVMLLAAPHGAAQESSARGSHAARGLGAALALALVLELGWALARSREPGLRAGTPAAWSAPDIGHVLFTDYSVAFEATSVLILLAMVGAVVLARRLTPAEEQESDAGPAGPAGEEAGSEEQTPADRG